MNNCHQPNGVISNNYTNIVGPQVRRWRFTRDWSQAKLAAQLQLKGFDVSRGIVAQIEGQTHCVKDKDLFFFVRAFGIGLYDLFPASQINGEIIHDHYFHKVSMLKRLS